MMDTDNKQVQPAEYLELAQRYVAGDQSVAPQLRALVHQQAKQWMGDKAQIVDAAGEPRVVYHGTPNEFNAFSHDYMGTQGTADGQGFYFTDDADFAEKYQKGSGRSISAYLKIENALSANELTLTKADAANMLKIIDPDGDSLLSNYGDVGYEGYSAVLREAVESEWGAAANDADFIGSLLNSGTDITAAYDALEQVKGSSGIVVPKEDGSTHYIVGKPNQIKSAELVTFDDAGHIIPLPQRFDPQQNDIRYSHAPVAAGHSQDVYDAAKAAGKTELTYLQWLQVRTPEFKAWFGDWENDPANASKVINQNTGEPLVMHHASPWNPLIEQPGKAVFRQGTNGGLSGDGIYFSEYPLGQFGQHVTEVFLNIRNPLNRETTKDEKYDAAYENLHLEEAAERFFMRGFLKKDALKLFPEFDGVHNRSESVVVHSGQIKSATDNIGRFAPNEADIRYRLSPQHETDVATAAGSVPNTEPQQPQPNPATAIRAQLEQVLGDKAVLVNVVDAAQQPPHQAMKLISGSVEGWFDGRSGQINLVAATVTPERAAWVAWHELGHRGVALAHFDDYRAVMQDADQNSTVRALADAVQQERRQYRFDPAADTREVAVEEALVELYAAQKTGNYAALETRYGIKVPAAVKPGIAGTLQRVAEKLGTVLNQVFGRQPHNAFSHAEVFGLLHVFDRHSGKNAGSPNTGVRYSQAPPAPSSSSSTMTEPDHATQRLARAKDNYHSQSYLLTNTERQHRAVLEYGMEKLTTTMPPALKAEVQANFYENQVRQTANLMDVPTGFRQPEASVTLSSVSPMTSAQASAAVSMGNQSDHEIDR